MDEQKITTADLYGTSSAEPGTPPTPAASPPVEETPEFPLEPAVQPAASADLLQTPPLPTEHPVNKPLQGSVFLFIFFFVVLFIVGIFISMYIHGFVPSGGTVVHQQSTPTAAPTSTPIPTPPDPFASWKSYAMTEGSTPSGFYKLPPNVAAPVCDGPSCISRGTTLPGGTRFTISVKNVSQSLSSLGGARIIDASGLAFTSNTATVSGHFAIAFDGAFSGKTSDGYGFSEMRGFMVEISPSLTMEINHFAPEGATVDWTRDDALFDQILSQITFSSPSATGK